MRLLLGFLVRFRRRIVHLGITETSTAEWTSRQMLEAFPWDTAPRYLIRDRDSIYGDLFRRRVSVMKSPIT